MTPTLPDRSSPTIAALVALLVATVLLAGCGNDDASDHEVDTSASDASFNDADVAFTTDMIQHHAQALAMVDLAMGRQLDPGVQRLAEDVLTTQGPEIEQLTDWLIEWDRPVPETVRDHANAHGDGHVDMDSDLPGMMSAEEMTDLETATAAEFQDLWLELMIVHHRGAIEMARTEQSDGTFGPAQDLAETMGSTQQDEISTMELLLGS